MPLTYKLDEAQFVLFGDLGPRATGLLTATVEICNR